MKQIRKHTQKAKKTTSKNTRSGVKRERGVIPQYKINKEKQIQSLRDSKLYPKENRSRLEDNFINDYQEFMRFFMNTWEFIDYKKFNEFLTGYYFQTFQKNVNTRLKGNRRRNKLNEKDLDASFVLRWNWFLQSFESLLDDLPVELSQLGIEMIRPQLSHFKKLLDYERRKEGKSILSDDYLTQEGLTRF